MTVTILYSEEVERRHRERDIAEMERESIHGSLRDVAAHEITARYVDRSPFFVFVRWSVNLVSQTTMEVKLRRPTFEATLGHGGTVIIIQLGLNKTGPLTQCNVSSVAGYHFL